MTPASPKALPFTACSPNCAASCLWGPELDSCGLEPAATTVKENAPETGHRVLVDGVLSDVPALWPAFSKATHVTSRSERRHQEATPEHDGNQGKCPGPQAFPDETPGAGAASRLVVAITPGDFAPLSPEVWAQHEAGYGRKVDGTILSR